MDERPAEQNADGEVAWYALRTQHQHEKAAADSLTNKRFETFLPLYQTVRQWNDRKKRLSLPLFPGYLFIRAGLRRWRDVVTTPGIWGFVQIGNQAAVIPDDEIEVVRRIVNGPLQAEPHPFLKCGDWVRVKSGPLTDIQGILVSKKNQFRLVLSVEMLGKSVSVEVESTTVEPLPARRGGLGATQAAGSDSFPRARRMEIRDSSPLNAAVRGL
jgi:transcription antitermination factor NusG